MSTSLHIPDLPQEIHDTLAGRARQQRVSLNRYVLDVLEQHCAVPTTAVPTWDEWLSNLSRSAPVEPAIPAADAEPQSR